MLKQFVRQISLMTDSGKTLKTPFKWLYLFNAIMCFVPLAGGLFACFHFWDDLTTALGTSFWPRFISVFMAELGLLTLLVLGLIGYHYWYYRKSALDSVIRTGSKIVAIPLVADLNQRFGEVNSLFIAVVPVFAAILVFIACLLTNGHAFYTEWNWLPMLGCLIGIPIVSCLLAYLNLLLTRFVSERLKLIPSIGNDVQRIANGKSGENVPVAEEEDYKFVMPEITPRDKKLVTGAILLAAVIALGYSTYVSITTSAAYNRSIYKELTNKEIARVQNAHPGFADIYSQARSLAAASADSASKYMSISYKDLEKYKKSVLDNEKFAAKHSAAAKQEFAEKVYPPIKDQIATKHAEWKAFYDKHNLDQYLVIKPNTGIVKQTQYYYSYYRPSYWFTVEEPKGKVNSAKVTCIITNDSGRSVGSFDATLAEIKERSSSNSYWYNNGFDDVNFWDNHSMKVVINSVTLSDGTKLEASDLEKVPVEVKEYLNNPGPETEIAFVRAVINPDYKGEEEYIKNYVEMQKREKNPRIYDLLTLE